LFGPPVPVPNTNTTPTSHCNILTVGASASGAATCEGSIASLDLPLGLDIFLTGDMLSSTNGPVDVPGIQACPLCSPQCTGGGDAGQPCQDSSDCSGTCDGTPNCIGGPNDGDSCTPGSSALTGSFPTSHDCAPDPGGEIVSDLPLDLSLTTGQVTVNGIDHPQSRRTFCGFCRDMLVEGSECYDGEPDPGMIKGCPDSVAQPTCQPASGSTTGCGAAIPCTDDSDCTAPYESCAQRNPGAFTFAAVTQTNLAGSTAGECLADAQPHDATLASTFCIPPSFDPSADAALDWPGPGAVTLQGSTTLSP
jgi:hypothetical protein